MALTLLYPVIRTLFDLAFQCGKRISALSGEALLLHEPNLRGLELEEHIFNQLETLLNTVGTLNVTAISGLENKDGNAKFEIDFLIIMGEQKIILQVEAKVSLNVKQRKKVNEQFQNGETFFKKMDHFQRGDCWRYLKVIYTREISPNADICDGCKPFILDNNSNLMDWWSFVLSCSSQGM